MQSEKTNHHFPSDDVQDRIFVFMNENTQDPCVDGTVVFRGQRFTQHCFFDKEEIALVMASYPTSCSRYRTHNLGCFQMIQEHQSNMPSRSMGMSGNQTKHHYYNETFTNTSLVLLTSSFMNKLFHVTRQVQDSSGQILFGLVKSAFKKACDWKSIRSDHVCPYGIMTCPRIDKKKSVLDSFSNCGHHDLTDCTNKVKGNIISDNVHVPQSKMVHE
jgi:hypothetical protein